MGEELLKVFLLRKYNQILETKSEFENTSQSPLAFDEIK